MLARIEPYGRSPFTVECDATCTDSVHGGFKEAQIAAELSRSQRDRLLDAEVYLLGDNGPFWHGRVWDFGENTLRCGGTQSAMQHDPDEVWYCSTALSEWQERTNVSRNTDIMLQVDTALLRAIWTNGTVYPALAANGWLLRVPNLDSFTISFSWTRPTEADYRFVIYTSSYSAVGSNGEEIGGYTQRHFQPTATGSGTSGTFSATINASNTDWILINAQNVGSVTPGSDVSMTFSDLKLYGTPVYTNYADDTLLHALNAWDSSYGATFTPSTVAPSTLTVTTGTLVSGVVGDLAADGGSDVHVDEAASTPGFDVRMAFTTSVLPRTVILRHYYNGSSTHVVKAQAYNGSTWDDLTPAYPYYGSSLVYVSYGGFTASHLIAGAVTVRFYHSSMGDTAHDIHIDSALLQVVTEGTPTALTQWVEADTTTLDHLVFDETDTTATKVMAIAQRTGKQFLWRLRNIGAQWVPVPVYRTEPATPKYSAAVDGMEVSADIKQADMDSLATTIRVRYKTAEGSGRYVDVSVSCPPLERVGRTRTVVIDADTSSTTRAQSAGAYYGSLINNDVQGTVTVKRAISGVEPCYIEAGELIELKHPELGTLTGRIVEVTKRGLGEAVLTLGQTYDPATATARMVNLSKSRQVPGGRVMGAPGSWRSRFRRPR